MNVLEVKNLKKSFKKTEVLKGVTFNVAKGEILGFIGPNGSGKSTTMKCIATLLYADEGLVKICGYDNIKERSLALNEMSVQIESPGLYYALSGLDNLKLFAKLKNVDKERVNEVIDFIGIGQDLKRKVKDYSMGMKQRLALGITILNKPKFIMLDEPTNGLDPAGVINLRKTIFKLRDQGTTFLISSHQLNEIEKICDRIIAINDGKVSDISHHLQALQTYRLIVEDSKKAELILKDKDYINEFSKEKDSFKISFNDGLGLNKLLDDLRQASIHIFEISKEVVDIEEIYLDIYGEDYEKSA